MVYLTDGFTITINQVQTTFLAYVKEVCLEGKPSVVRCFLSHLDQVVYVSTLTAR